MGTIVETCCGDCNKEKKDEDDSNKEKKNEIYQVFISKSLQSDIKYPSMAPAREFKPYIINP